MSENSNSKHKTSSRSKHRRSKHNSKSRDVKSNNKSKQKGGSDSMPLSLRINLDLVGDQYKNARKNFLMYLNQSPFLKRTLIRAGLGK